MKRGEIGSTKNRYTRRTSQSLGSESLTRRQTQELLVLWQLDTAVGVCGRIAMFRTLFCSKSSLSLSVKHSRSLSRYSESYLHTHDHQLYATPSINYCHLFILTLLFFSDSFMMTSSIPLFYNYFQSDYGPVGISLLFTVYSFFTIISNPLSSFLIDRKGPKIPLMYGVILLILATVLFILSFNFQSDKIHSYGILIVAQSLHGMASPLIQGSGLSLITMSHANENRLYSVKIITSISLLGYLLGPLFSGLLYSHLNSLSVYIPPAILISIAFFSFLTVFNAGHSILINEMTDEDAEIAIGLLPSAHSQHHPPSSTSVSHNQIHSHSHQSIATSFYGKQRIENFYSFLNLFLNKFHLITFISSLLSTLLLGVLFPLSPIYLHEQFHLNIFQQGLALTLLLLSIALLSPLLSYFIDKTSVSSLNSYSYHETVHSANQLTALTQYQAIYIGLLLVGLALCCMVWVTNIYMWVAVWLSLGIGFTILTIPLMRFFGEIAEVFFLPPLHLPLHLSLPYSLFCYALLSF
jgi:MFS family permease